MRSSVTGNIVWAVRLCFQATKILQTPILQIQVSHTHARINIGQYNNSRLFSILFPLIKNLIRFFLSSWTTYSTNFHDNTQFPIICGCTVPKIENHTYDWKLFFHFAISPHTKITKKEKYKCSNIGVNMLSSSPVCNIRSSQANFDLLWSYYNNIFYFFVAIFCW